MLSDEEKANNNNDNVDKDSMDDNYGTVDVVVVSAIGYNQEDIW